jgi:OPA family glycerol-3-phosphate transporter-like MFS transporter 1/2
LKASTSPGVLVQAKGVSIWAALRIPGVMSFALTLFFSKLVAYTFLYWLPFYLNSVDIGGRRLTPKVGCAALNS